jgi:hypothetical protein
VEKDEERRRRRRMWRMRKRRKRRKRWREVSAHGKIVGVCCQCIGEARTEEEEG